MSKQQLWNYCNISHSSHGTMICNNCGKRITEGQYRVRTNKKDEYIVQHRACSTNDVNWKILDETQNKSLQQFSERLKAYKEFKNRWNISIEEIETMEEYLNHDNQKV